MDTIHNKILQGWDELFTTSDPEISMQSPDHKVPKFLIWTEPFFHFIQITSTQRQENLIRAGTNKPRFHHQSIKIEKDICTPKYLEEIGTISIAWNSLFTIWLPFLIQIWYWKWKSRIYRENKSDCYNLFECIWISIFAGRNQNGVLEKIRGLSYES